MTSGEQHPAAKRGNNDAMSDFESPGKIIERARENAKLSQADLAQRLRLDTRYIRHLELDNFEQLPGPTFIKGYLRSVAKELGIAAEPLVNAYTRVSKTELEPTLADFESRPPPQVSSNSFMVKAGSYALAITLVLLLVFWWQSNDDNPPGNQDATLSEEDTHTSTPLPNEFEQVVHDDSPFVAIPETETSIDNLSNQDVTSDGMETPGDEIATDGDEGFNLSLRTSAESWVEIYDRDGKQLYFGMANTRSPLRINSAKPLDLLIGNTPTVELTINGQEIDLESLAVDGVAKFKYP